MPYNEDRDFALVVGIDDYPRYGTHGRDLEGAIRDAKLFAEWLQDTEAGGGLKGEHCRVITSDGDPMALSKDAIDDAMDEIWTLARAHPEGGRRLYMFFSGHGQLVDSADFESYEQALCLPRWSYTRPNSAVLTDSYGKTAQKCMPFEEIAVFLDCCRVSTIRVRADNTSLGCTQFQNGHETIRKQIFFAAEPMKRAFEGDGGADGDDDDEGEIIHGHFTSALIDGLRRGSERAGGGISAKDLWVHLDYWVQKIAEKAGHNQKPRIDPPTPYDDMIFGKATPATDGSNFEIRFHDWRQGPVQLLNADADLIKEGDPAEGPWPIQLQQELYLLMDVTSQDRYSLHFRPEMEGSYVTF